MSIETEIAELAAAYMSLKQRYESKPDVFDERLAQFKSSFQSTIDNLDAGLIYVDQSAGDDANDGASTRPVASLSAAVNLIPLGGIGNIRLLSDIDLDEGILITHRFVQFSGNFSIKQTYPYAIRLGRKCYVGINIGNLTTALQSRDDPSASYDNAMFQGAGPFSAAKISISQTPIVLGDCPLVGSDKRPAFLNELSLAYNGASIRDGTRAAPRLLASYEGNWQIDVSLFPIPSDYTWADLFLIENGAALTNLSI